MLSCSECAELLLDYLYGLLDEPEALSLRDHLAGCTACQQALAQAKLQQNILAQAARKYREVPLFEIPADERDILPMVSGAVQSATQAPTAQPVQSRRPAAWRRWMPMAAAAAVVLAVGTVYASYQSGLSDHQLALSDARRQVESLEAKLVSLKSATESEAMSLAARTQGKFLLVQVLGPATYQPSAANSYRLKTHLLNGQPALAKVTVKLIVEAEKVVFSEVFQTKGDLRFTLPAKLPVAAGSKPRLVIEADSGNAKEIIEQALAVAEPRFVTHIAMNKSVFHGGDTLFFRTLTLDRYGLTPVDRPLTLSCQLVASAGGQIVPVQQLHCTPESGGIAGGEMLLPADLPYGPYLLMVTELSDGKATQPLMRPVSRHVMVEPGGKSGIVADKKADKAKAMIAPAAAGPRLTAEFFPEGGDLIAGTVNRVYFRLQHSMLLPKNWEAVIENSQQQEVLKFKLSGDTIQVGNQTLGSFTFTPQGKQTYRFRVNANGKSLDGFPLPAVRADGISLTVPNTVVAAGKPVEVKVRSFDKPLLITVSSRGHIVDQKIIEKSDKVIDVTLEPLAGADGVLRVTVYEKDGSNWQPAAERLVYRQPAQFLKLSTNLPEKGFKPGEHVQMRIDASNESDVKKASWMNALVIDQAALKTGGDHEMSVPTFFLMGGELQHPEDLEDADFLLLDTANSSKALDLFLGTQGWRRFATKQQTNDPVQLTVSRGQADGGQLALFSAGTKSDALMAQFANAVRKQQEEIVQHANDERETLVADRDMAANKARTAAASLAEYEQLPMMWLRYSVGAAVAIFLVAGTLLLVLGLIVALRARSSPRLMLVGSFCVLLMGLVLFSATGSLRMGDTNTDGNQWIAWLTPGLAMPKWQVQGGDDKAKSDQPRVTAELYAAAASKNVRDNPTAGADAAIGRGSLSMENKVISGLKAPGGAKGGKGGGFGGGGGAGGAPLKKDGKEVQPLQGATNPQAIVGNAKAMDQAAQSKAGVLRQFANSASFNMVGTQELLLWAPNLFAGDGSANVEFDLPGKVTTYRIVIYGNTADGRLGVYHGKLDAK